MSYIKEYADKLKTAEEAVAIVKSGDWLDYGWTTATVRALDEALAERIKKEPELKDLKIRGGILMWEPEIFKLPDAKEHFTWNSWHMSGIERKAVAKGFSFYDPLRYSELPRYYRENITPPDVAMFQVAPMDKHGYFNFGPNASHMMAVCERAKVVIVEVNENMPRCLGGFEEAIHISKVDVIVEGENPAMAEMGAGGPATDVDIAVANLIVPEIPNGACLQLGIGGMPNTVGAMIAESDLKDLGVHTEMYVDAFVDLSRAGKVTGSQKTVNRYKQVYAFAAGTKKLYDFLDDNPECMAVPVNYANDIDTIGNIDNFISINNAVDIDLYGQVNAETAGTKQISGAGGQLDFVLGAYKSKGGKSFICCSSAFKDKKGELHSRIRPTLANGSVVTDTRANIHYLVTEYGIVNLKGLSTWERAEAIIKVAHPQFQDELIAEAEKMNIWRRTNKED
ncbi:butyryl-CoA:acetate CoA-transferase [Eubacterium aggregans]|uniref:butyryl-CoA:acetate CoA-transferase n=1 Tax=Eubacterium aggregans TaxID=81409 RepID=UPI0023F42EFA|nr:butyryl-CoA:acetate CoA-transferase [Eubacterium aggregans]MDD4692376.1 butyryl-CoA:acetate CoA-transferase [Eubacterium aggregans]